MAVHCLKNATYWGTDQMTVAPWDDGSLIVLRIGPAEQGKTKYVLLTAEEAQEVAEDLRARAKTLLRAKVKRTSN